MSAVSKSYAVPFCRYDANTECSNIYIVAFYLITRWIPVGRSLRGGVVYINEKRRSFLLRFVRRQGLEPWTH